MQNLNYTEQTQALKHLAQLKHSKELNLRKIAEKMLKNQKNMNHKSQIYLVLAMLTRP